jgi:hypothetical protein
MENEKLSGSFNAQTDEQLVQAAKAGDGDALSCCARGIFPLHESAPQILRACA